MKPHLVCTVCAALALGAAPALADCREELAALEGGVAKDGSLAPLQAPSDATPQQGTDAGADTGAGADATPDEPKDGSDTPLAADPGVATSAEDAQAQSQGGETAAAQAAGAAGGGSTAKADALARARAALDAGDEAGCLSAVEEAKGA